MPKKIVCHNAPYKKNEKQGTPLECYKIGRKSGFAGAMSKQGPRPLQSEFEAVQKGIRGYFNRNTEEITRNSKSDRLRDVYKLSKLKVAGVDVRSDRETLSNTLRNAGITRAGIILGAGKCSA